MFIYSHKPGGSDQAADKSDSEQLTSNRRGQANTNLHKSEFSVNVHGLS